MFDIFFALVNFSVVAGLLYYGWLRYGFSAVHSMMQKESADLHILHEEHRKLLKECQTLDESIVAQQAECNALSVKVITWKSIAEKAQATYAEEQQQMQEIYRKKLEEQAEKHRSALLYKKVKPLVIAQVEEELERYFKDPEAMRSYKNRLLRKLTHE
ncbi:hypothetical protein H0W26_05735 [Candidatus Dependentiae bacterium]|nr:hypothetical protein [Candidatus Dependentiae bacterium]